MSSAPLETEIKLTIASAEAGRRMLAQCGFRVLRERVFERNTVFDTTEGRIRNDGKLLRVREAGGSCILTYKGPARPGKHKSREEVETPVGNARAIHAILERLGYAPSLIYEKHRTEFHLPGSPGVATLDETPIGTFLELEGEAEWIDRVAHLMGFTEGDYITASYGRLYLEYCRREGIQPAKPARMVFT